STHGTVITDIDANQHYARNLSPGFGVQKGIFLTNAELTYQVLEDVVWSAYGEKEMATEKESRDGTGHALIVADADRDDGGAQNGGRGGRGGRERRRRND
ncbi:unnamed protein product, partial [Laminaria digitata]